MWWAIPFQFHFKDWGSVVDTFHSVPWNRRSLWFTLLASCWIPFMLADQDCLNILTPLPGLNSGFSSPTSGGNGKLVDKHRGHCAWEVQKQKCFFCCLIYVQLKLLNLACLNSDIWITQALQMVLTYIHVFLWKQILINSYKIWQKSCNLDSTTGDWLPQSATASSCLVVCQPLSLI